MKKRLAGIQLVSKITEEAFHQKQSHTGPILRLTSIYLKRTERQYQTKLDEGQYFWKKRKL